MDKKLVTAIKKQIDNIYTCSKDKYVKHTTICLSLIIKTKVKVKVKLLHTFLCEVKYPIKRNLNKSILFFGSKSEYDKLQSANIVYGNDLELKAIKREKYEFCIIKDNKILSKHKSILTKKGILAANQSHFENDAEFVNKITSFYITKYSQQCNSFNCKAGDIKTNTASEICENIYTIIKSVQKEDYNVNKVVLYRNMCHAHLICK